ncbi:hypothetical protein HDU93_008314, partial [Gonapodya sp. JEL0774]
AGDIVGLEKRDSEGDGGVVMFRIRESDRDHWHAVAQCLLNDITEGEYSEGVVIFTQNGEFTKAEETVKTKGTYNPKEGVVGAEVKASKRLEDGGVIVISRVCRDKGPKTIERDRQGKTALGQGILADNLRIGAEVGNIFAHCVTLHGCAEQTFKTGANGRGECADMGAYASKALGPQKLGDIGELKQLGECG